MEETKTEDDEEAMSETTKGNEDYRDQDEEYGDAEEREEYAPPAPATPKGKGRASRSFEAPATLTKPQAHMADLSLISGSTASSDLDSNLSAYILPSKKGALKSKKKIILSDDDDVDAPNEQATVKKKKR